jgi:23S rRNA pseudouridine1911/1915/1917 synthase
VEQEELSFPDNEVRLDIFVTNQDPRVSRSFAAKLIEDGHVYVNSKQMRKAGQKVMPFDSLKIDFDFASLNVYPSLQLQILYEDNDCVVISKPAGILSHSKGGYNPEPTVETWLQARIPKLQGDRAGIVHRLDRLTSGVMICAKSPTAKSWLQKQFSLRKVKKSYVAIVSGIVKPSHAIIDIPIERNPKKPQTFHTGINGKQSVTEYQVIERSGNLTLLDLKPQTGRTHQLRVHLKHLGYPILGDTLYGGSPADRLYLHALSLEITLPNRERKTFISALPDEFETIMKEKPHAANQ